MADVYRRGFEELGYSTVDCNGESQTGEPMQNHLFMMNLELRISARWYNVKQPHNKKDLQQLNIHLYSNHYGELYTSCNEMDGCDYDRILQFLLTLKRY